MVRECLLSLPELELAYLRLSLFSTGSSYLQDLVAASLVLVKGPEDRSLVNHPDLPGKRAKLACMHPKN